MEISATLWMQAVTFLVFLAVARLFWRRFMSRLGIRQVPPRFGDGKGGGDGGGSGGGE